MLWTTVIVVFSSATFSAEQTGGVLQRLLWLLWPGISPEQQAGLHVLIRKGAHVSAYAILSLCWHYALPGHRRQHLIALAACLLTAAWDEHHQAHIPERTGALLDIAYDMAGAVLATLGWRVYASQRRSEGAASSR